MTHMWPEAFPLSVRKLTAFKIYVDGKNIFVAVHQITSGDFRVIFYVMSVN